MLYCDSCAEFHNLPVYSHRIFSRCRVCNRDIMCYNNHEAFIDDDGNVRASSDKAEK